MKALLFLLTIAGTIASIKSAWFLPHPESSGTEVVTSAKSEVEAGKRQMEWQNVFGEAVPFPNGCNLVRPQESLSLARTTFPDGEMKRVHEHTFYSVTGICSPFEEVRFYFEDTEADPRITEVSFYFPIEPDERRRTRELVRKQALVAFKDVPHHVTASGKVEWPDLHGYKVGVDDGGFYVVKGW